MFILTDNPPTKHWTRTVQCGEQLPASVLATLSGEKLTMWSGAVRVRVPANCVGIPVGRMPQYGGKFLWRIKQGDEK